MALADDIAADYRHVDGIERVTFDDGVNSTATVQAHREKLSFREATLGGPVGIGPQDIVWVVWSATLGDVEPCRLATITDSESNVWTVLSLTETALGTTSIHWRCICRKQE